MKLRNKKTGEIFDYKDFEYDLLSTYESIAKLNEDWEDYEEPEEFWYINIFGEVNKETFDETKFLDKKTKEIGDYFSTKEEAEKAVEKLKAWKRLRDNGLKIIRYGKYAYDPKSTHHINIALDYISDENKKDLDLLFGGEENETN